MRKRNPQRRRLAMKIKLFLVELELKLKLELELQLYLKKKVLLAGFAFGASVGIFTKCFFQTDQNSVVSFLVGAAICFGAFWCGAKVSRLRLIIYASGLSVSYVFIYLWFVIASDMIFDGLTYSS
ncbi:hypothetical protein FXO37_24627 [Capsicum annuum]|nr:hypothetical protein FXO37_24627 [Capsicum annuum]